MFKDILFNTGDEEIGHCAFEIEVGIGVILPGGTTDITVWVGDEAVDIALGDLVGIAVGIGGWGGVEFGVGEDAVGGGGGAKGVLGEAEDFFDFGRADVGLAFFELIEVLVVMG